jgi:uncharacterized protein (DUF1697 family)
MHKHVSQRTFRRDNYHGLPTSAHSTHVRRHIAFLRAINVGRRIVKMTQLVNVFEALGCIEVETFLASGNVIFTAKNASNPGMVSTIEGGLSDALGYDVETFVRTVDEVGKLATLELFDRASVESACGLYIGFLAQPLSAAGVVALEKLNNSTQQFRTEGREIQWLLHRSMADAKFSNVRFEKAIGAKATFRTRNTIVRLATKYVPQAGL